MRAFALYSFAAFPTLVALVGLGCASTDDLESRADYPTPKRGAIVCEHPLAAAAGLEILESGGNAADAAVATALALAVVYPRAGNLGGGGFAVWVAHDPTKPPLSLDFREVSPRRLSRGHFQDENGVPVPSRSVDTALGVAVPGSPAGLWELHQRLGRMLFTEVAAPAIRLARDGFVVDERLAAILGRDPIRRRLTREGGARRLFYPRGEALSAGDRLVQPELAATLDEYARNGPRAIYGGRIGDAMVQAVRAGGGVLEKGDLETYLGRIASGDEPVWRDPLRGWFRGMEVITVPPPSSGGLVLLQVLSMLDGFPLDDEIEVAKRSAVERGEPIPEGDAALSARAVHWWIEAMRRAFADRAEHMGDPLYHENPVEALLSAKWIAERRVSIGESANPAIGPYALPPPESPETTHLSVIDRAGNAVSLTTTLNTSFGCGILVPSAGFFLNNEIDDFAIFPGVPNEYGLVGGAANAIAPAKRPLSSMTPTIVRDGGQVVRWVFGAPGGPMIISSIIQVFLRAEVYGQSLERAVAAPRLHQQWNPTATRFEDGWDARLLSRLKARGHVVEPVEKGRFGRVQAILVEVGADPRGVSDPRGGGAVAHERTGTVVVPARD